MRPPTDEEIRAENYRRSREKRRRAYRERQRKLRGNTAAAETVKRNWQAVRAGDCGDTSYAENRR